jgi:tRNA dimethylallyltransferase
MLDSIYRERVDVFLTTHLHGVIVVYWPTACGKSGLAVEIAEYLRSEVISADSRQIYRGLDIGTGKITEAEMRGIPHHMLDVIDPTVTYSMVDYRDQALPILEEMRKWWKTPIICGGTGLYIDGLVCEMAVPDSVPDWGYRAELEEIRLQSGNQALYDMLARVDPAYARELDVNNYRYVMRGLEVIRETGRSKRESYDTRTSRFPTLYITPYDWDRIALYARIDQRVEKMFQSWLIDEVWYNTDKYNPTAPGLVTIWYREVVSYLQWAITLERALELVQQHSRNYAKRQITWNKKYS